MFPVPTITILLDDVINHSCWVQDARVSLDLYTLPWFTRRFVTAEIWQLCNEKASFFVMTVLY